MTEEEVIKIINKIKKDGYGQNIKLNANNCSDRVIDLVNELDEEKFKKFLAYISVYSDISLDVINKFKYKNLIVENIFRDSLRAIHSWKHFFESDELVKLLIENEEFSDSTDIAILYSLFWYGSDVLEKYEKTYNKSIIDDLEKKYIDCLAFHTNYSDQFNSYIDLYTNVLDDEYLLKIINLTPDKTIFEYCYKNLSDEIKNDELKNYKDENDYLEKKRLKNKINWIYKENKIRYLFEILEKIEDLDEEDIEKLESIIDSVNYEEVTKKYTEYYRKIDYSKPICKRFINKITDYMDNNNYIISNYSNFVRKASLDELRIFDKYIDKNIINFIGRGENVVDYVLEKLENDPTYFKEINVDICKYFINYIDSKEKIFKLVSYLDKEQQDNILNTYINFFPEICIDKIKKGESFNYDILIDADEIYCDISEIVNEINSLTTKQFIEFLVRSKFRNVETSFFESLKYNYIIPIHLIKNNLSDEGYNAFFKSYKLLKLFLEYEDLDFYLSNNIIKYIYDNSMDIIEEHPELRELENYKVIQKYVEDNITTAFLFPIESVVPYLSDEKIIDLISGCCYSSVIEKLFEGLSSEKKDEILNEYDGNFELFKNVVYLKKLINDFYESRNDVDLLYNVKAIKNICFSYSNEVWDKIDNDLKNKMDELIDIIKEKNLHGLIDAYFEDYNPDFYDNQFRQKFIKYVFEGLESGLYNAEPNFSFYEKVSEQDLIKVSKYIPKDNLLKNVFNGKNVYNLVMKYFEEDEKYFEDVKVRNYSYVHCNFSYEEIVNLKNHLSEEQYKILFKGKFIEKYPEIKDLYVEYVSNNPNELCEFSHIRYFEDNLYNVLENMTASIFLRITMGLHYFDEFKPNDKEMEIIKKVCNDKIDEVISYTNRIISRGDEEEILKYINYLEDDNFKKFVQGCNSSRVLEKLLPRISGMLYDYAENKFVNECEDAIFGIFFRAPTIFSANIENSKKLSIINKLSVYKIYDIYSNTLNNSFCINYLWNSFEDKSMFDDITYTLMFDDFYNSLSEKRKVVIDEFINNLSNDKYPDLNDYVTNTGDKINLCISIEKNLINDDNIEIVRDLLSKNKYLFSTMDFKLLSDSLSKMGEHFIEKTSRYPLISRKITKLSNNPDKYGLILQLSDYLIKNRKNELYDKEIEIIINFLCANDINISKDSLTEEDLQNIENYILECNISYENMKYNPETYIAQKNNYLDSIIDTIDDIDKLKDIIYQRIFHINKKIVDDFLVSYVTKWDTVKDNSKYNLDDYISKLLYIKNVEDINELREIYSIAKNENNFSYSYYLNTISIMGDTYTENISENIKNKQNGTNVELNIDGTKVSATELLEDFGIFVHSTCAYGEMPLINDNYFDSWNLSNNTANHGICTSYISNSNYGTADVKNTGVMFGFTNIEEGAIPLMAPYDLVTYNSGYTIKSMRNPFYTSLEDIPNYTRHTHNEISLERRINDREIRQPDCIIIFEDMDDNIKQNSIKAYNDFKEKGIDLKIIYIDRVKLASNEAEKIRRECIKYRCTFDLSMLSEIINKYESNICGCDFIGMGRDESKNLFNQDELFMTEEINKLLQDTLDYINDCKDIEIKRNLIETFKSIMDNEQRKFDLISFDGSRGHKFLLYTDEIKDRIDYISNNLVEMNKMIV